VQEVGHAHGRVIASELQVNANQRLAEEGEESMCQIQYDQGSLVGGFQQNENDR
jgi:hypothetical protein